MASQTRNPARHSGYDMDQLLARFTTAGAAPASAGKARGNTVRRIQRTGVGAFSITFRAGVIPSAASVANSRASVEAPSAAVNNIATIESFTFSSNGETVVALIVRRSDTGAAVETTGSVINVQIDLELSGIFPTVDTLD